VTEDSGSGHAYRLRCGPPGRKSLLPLESVFINRLFPDGERIADRTYVVYALGLNRKDARDVATFFGERLHRTLKRGLSTYKVPDPDMLIDGVLDEVKAYYNRSETVSKYADKISLQKLSRGLFEVRPHFAGANLEVNKQATVAKALETGSLLRFVYPDTDGFEMTRRVRVKGLLLRDEAIVGFRAVRFNADSQEVSRNYSLSKASELYYETTSSKVLSHEIAIWCSITDGRLKVTFGSSGMR